jgi:hypothetical protein
MFLTSTFRPPVDKEQRLKSDPGMMPFNDKVPMGQTFRHMIIRIGHRYVTGKKAIDMNRILKDLAVEGIWAYWVEDMLILQFGNMVTNDVSRIVFSILGKAGLEALGERYIFGKKDLRKAFMDGLMNNAVVEIVDALYTQYVVSSNVMETGKKRTFL